MRPYREKIILYPVTLFVLLATKPPLPYPPFGGSFLHTSPGYSSSTVEW